MDDACCLMISNNAYTLSFSSRCMALSLLDEGWLSLGWWMVEMKNERGMIAGTIEFRRHEAAAPFAQSSNWTALLSRDRTHGQVVVLISH